MIHPDRKIRCGPFTELQLPIELLLEYQKRHKSKENNILNIQNLQRYKNHVEKIDSFRVDYPKQLEVPRHDLS